MPTRWPIPLGPIQARTSSFCSPLSPPLASHPHIRPHTVCRGTSTACQCPMVSFPKMLEPDAVGVDELAPSSRLAHRVIGSVKPAHHAVICPHNYFLSVQVTIEVFQCTDYCEQLAALCLPEIYWRTLLRASLVLHLGEDRPRAHLSMFVGNP